MRRFLDILICCILTAGCSSSAFSPRERMDFNDGWRFQLGDVAEASCPDFDDSGWRKLDLPHDWAVEGDFSIDNPSGTGGGALPGGIGWYRKTFVPSSADSDRLWRIDFDGVYMNAEVFVNGESLVGTERGQNLHLALFVGGDFIVPLERINGIVGRADELNPGSVDYAAHRHRLFGESPVALIVDFLRGRFVELLGNAEIVLKLEIRPVIEGIADEFRKRRRPRLERLIRIGKSRPRNGILLKTAGSHLAPFVMIASEPYLGNRLVPAVFGDVFRVDVAMIVDDRHLRGILVIQLFGRCRLQKKILV